MPVPCRCSFRTRFALLMTAGVALASMAFADGTPRFEVVTAFARSPERPARGGLVQVSQGILYGTTSVGGDYACGAIYKVQGAVFTPVLHFTGNSGAAKGSLPSGTLLLDGTVLWGTTSTGGEGKVGTVFKFDTATGYFTTVVDFGLRSTADPGYLGERPQAGLVRDGNGVLWGVTTSRIFKVDSATGDAVPVVPLTAIGAAGPGAQPLGELAFDGVDSLWGAAKDFAGFGKVYKVHQDTGIYTQAAAFTGAAGAAPGKYPKGSLLADGSGFMVGLCSPAVDGTGSGQVYRIKISTGEYSVAGLLPLRTDITDVHDGLVKTSTGSFVGMASTGLYNGSLFSFSIPGVNSAAIKTFSQRATEGANPAALIALNEGGLAVTMAEGGRYGHGMVSSLYGWLGVFFSVSIGTAGSSDQLTGTLPAGGLMQDSEGRLWGMTERGGNYGDGSVYSFLPGDDKLKNAFSFNSSQFGGRFPKGELLMRTEPTGQTRLLGVTGSGGINEGSSQKYGGAFLASFYNGLVNTLSTFVPLTSNSQNPKSGFSRAPDGNFWSASGNEVYFYPFASSTRTIAATFTGTGGARPGSDPSGRLYFDGQGFAWGVTSGGGTGNFGTIYKITTTAPYVFTSVVQFTGTNGPAVGYGPNGALVADASGMLWGTTAYGGGPGKGTIFKLDRVHGMLTTVVTFDNVSHSVPGQYPSAGLVADGRGSLWGVTSNGGAADRGTLYRIDPATGAFESMFEFSADAPLGSAPGSTPRSPLFLHSDGNLYGTTTGLSLDGGGARKSGGNLFRIRFGRKLMVTSSEISPISRSHSILDGETSRFGTVNDVEDSHKTTFTIINPGPTAITGFTATVSGPHAADFKSSLTKPATLGGGGGMTVDVTFDPSALGDRNAVLTLGGTSTDTDAFVIPLVGTGGQRKVSIYQPSFLAESGGAQPVQVTLSAPLSVPVKVPFKVTLGSATAADFTISASPLVIPAGSTSGIIWVTPKKDYLVEGPDSAGQESFTITLNTPLHPNVGIASGAESTTVVIQDDDSLPTFDLVGGGTYAPGSVCGVPSGFSNPSGMPFTGYWTRNGRLITGATQPIFWIPAITSAYAGTYRYTIRTITGVTLSSNPIDIWVMDQVNVRPLVVVEGGIISMPSLAAGSGVGFSWTRTTATATDEPVSDGAKFSGATTATLTLKNAGAGDAGEYFCHTSGTDAQGVRFSLSVVTGAPQATAPQFPAAVVGKPYNYLLPRSGGGTAEPAVVIASGLPPGLVCDRVSGLITGRAAAVGHFKVSVTMSNSLGHSNTSAYLDVSKLPDAFVGSYVGLVAGGTYSSIGSRIDLTAAANGTVSGALTIGKIRRAFVGRLQLDDEGKAACEIWLPGSNSTRVDGIHLELTFDQQNHLGGHVTFGIDGSDVDGWRNVWNAAGHPAWSVDGYHTFALTDAGQCGSGYGTLVIGLNGSAVISGRLPDNSVFATSAPLHPNAWFMIYQSLYPELGGLTALAQVTPAVQPGGLDTIDQVSGAIWSTPPKKAKTRYFQNGVSSTSGHFLNVVGSSYSKPSPGANLLGLPVVPAGTSNAQFTFNIDATSDVSTFAAPNVNFRIGPDHKAVLPAPGTAANPGRVASALFNAATGTFTGAFTLDYQTPKARASAFKGMLVPGAGKGYGFFILPAPADPAAVPPTTLLTSPMISGQVELSVYPTPAP